jgi:hypothetical protein
MECSNVESSAISFLILSRVTALTYQRLQLSSMLRTELESRLYTHHPELYFPDGNIVIEMQTQDGLDTYFRLHQKVLNGYPLLLKSLTDPIGEMMEQTLFKSAENPKDLAVVLAFLYDPS